MNRVVLRNYLPDSLVFYANRLFALTDKPLAETAADSKESAVRLVIPQRSVMVRRKEPAKSSKCASEPYRGKIINRRLRPVFGLDTMEDL